MVRSVWRAAGLSLRLRSPMPPHLEARNGRPFWWKCSLYCSYAYLATDYPWGVRDACIDAVGVSHDGSVGHCSSWSSLMRKESVSPGAESVHTSRAANLMRYICLSGVFTPRFAINFSLSVKAS